MTTSRLDPRNQAFFKLIKENIGKTLTIQNILDATGWKKSTWTTHWGKRVYSPFLLELEEEAIEGYRVIATGDLDEATFHRRITQSHQGRELGASCKNPLARALLHKSKDNMVLALELYNRPSLDNRLDGFCVLFCMAWEQLLKAEIIETEGENQIYRTAKPGKRRETISLEEALTRRLKDDDPVRRNVAFIAELRHEATHLLMREVQGAMSRLFQSGVMNFAKRFLSTTDHPLFSSASAGLLSLISDFDTSPDVVSLRKMYGQVVGDEILELLTTISSEIRKHNNAEFAIPLEYSLVLTKKEKAGDIKLTPGEEAPANATIIEKHVSIESKYPYKAGMAAGQIAKEIGQDFTLHQFVTICHLEGWRRSNNEYHQQLTHPIKYNIYSRKAVDFCVDKIKSDPAYVLKAEDAYKVHLRKKKTRMPNEGPLEK